MVAIAARIHVAVGRRPRLAFADEHIDVVAAVLARHRDEVREVAPEVVDAVSSALSS
jgi:DNA-binding GntR family transcriptional regulator